MLLQQIDLNVEQELKEKHDYKHMADYQICRYVDDYFIFCKNKDMADKISEVIGIKLKRYELFIKHEKTIDFERRPFLEGISIVKNKLADLVNDTFENRLNTFIGFKRYNQGYVDVPVHHSFNQFVKAVRSIVATNKTFYSELNEDENEDKEENKKEDKGSKESLPNTIEYRSVMSFLLAMIHKHTKSLFLSFNRLFRQYEEAYKLHYLPDEGKKIRERYIKEFFEFSKSLVETLFFLMSSDCRMSTSIKIVAIINDMQKYVRGEYVFEDGTRSLRFSPKKVNELDEEITRQTSAVLRNVQITSYSNTLMETLNLLELQKRMIAPMRIAPKLLNELVLSDSFRENGMNLFTVFEIIHYMGNQSEYEDVCKVLEGWITERINSLCDSDISNAEDVFTFVETVTTPFVTDELRNKVKSKLNVEIDNLVAFLSRHKTSDMFISKHKYSVSKALEHASSGEVY